MNKDTQYMIEDGVNISIKTSNIISLLCTFAGLIAYLISNDIRWTLGVIITLRCVIGVVMGYVGFMFADDDEGEAE